jgi:small neutral amino acid transporter SnatA (MarC family)
MLDLVFNPFMTLLVLADPLGLALIFAAPRKGCPEKRRREAVIPDTTLQLSAVTYHQDCARLYSPAWRTGP